MSERSIVVEAISFKIPEAQRQSLYRQLAGDRGILYENQHTAGGRRVLIHLPAYRDSLWSVDTDRPSTIMLQPGDSSSLRSFAEAKLQAEEVIPLTNPVGTVRRGVWRPGLKDEIDIQYALDTSVEEEAAAERALFIIVEMLNDILQYIEPDEEGVSAYGHKTRNLLILACTEVENILRYYLRRIAGIEEDRLTTNDYVRLKMPLFLSEYAVLYRLPGASSIGLMRPFHGWDRNEPSKSIPWYEAYNATKHNRDQYFDQATLAHCIYSVAANIVLFCVRYSPYPLLDGHSPLANLVRHLFEIRLVEPEIGSFYVPRYRIERVVEGINTDPIINREAWSTEPLRLDK
jgi:hypothetical protein